MTNINNIPVPAILNEVYVSSSQGTQQFIELFMQSDSSLNGWELCYANTGSCISIPSNSVSTGWQSCNPYGICKSTLPIIYPKKSYLIFNIPNNQKLNPAQGVEVLLKDNKGNAIDFFQICTNSACNPKNWKVSIPNSSSDCKSVLNSNASNKDFARIKNAMGPFNAFTANNTPRHTKGKSNDNNNYSNTQNNQIIFREVY